MSLITNSNFDLSSSNLNFIEKKCAKLLNELPDASCNVRLTVKKTELKFICQILYKDIIVFVDDVDFHNCICGACKKFLNQNRRLNRKHVDRRLKDVKGDNLPVDDDLDDDEGNE